jgi:hypothetical protein
MPTPTRTLDQLDEWEAASLARYVFADETKPPLGPRSHLTRDEASECLWLSRVTGGNIALICEQRLAAINALQEWAP